MPSLVRSFAIRRILMSPQLWSASFWSAKYPLASPQVRRLPGVTGSAYRQAEFTRERYCACATYLLVELVNVAHLMWAQITKRAYFTKA